MVLPLTSYWPSPQQQADQQNLFAVLLSKCMNGSGFNYPVVEYDPISYGLDPGNGSFYVFGATSMAVAEKYGYSETDLTAIHPHTASGVKVPKPSQLSTAELTALEACTEKLGQEVAVDGSAGVPALVQEISVQAWDESKTNQQVLTNFKAWSACMASAGFRYANPLMALVGQVEGSTRAGLWDTPTPTSLQIQTAGRDVTCKQRTDLLTTWIRVLYDDQEALLTPNLPELRQGIAQFTAIIAKEQRLVVQAG
jgi:hypothetical protein